MRLDAGSGSGAGKAAKPAAKKTAKKTVARVTADRATTYTKSSKTAGSAKSGLAQRMKQNAGTADGAVRKGAKGKAYNVYDAKTGTWKRAAQTAKSTSYGDERRSPAPKKVTGVSGAAGGGRGFGLGSMGRGSGPARKSEAPPKEGATRKFKWGRGSSIQTYSNGKWSKTAELNMKGERLPKSRWTNGG